MEQAQEKPRSETDAPTARLPPTDLWIALGKKKVDPHAPQLKKNPIVEQVPPPEKAAKAAAPSKPLKAKTVVVKPQQPPPKRAEEKREPLMETRPMKDLSGVPSTLDGFFQPGTGRAGLHETLGVLVDAHTREAEAIMGRTNLLDRAEAMKVMRVLHFARVGYGGPLKRARPWLSAAVLDALRLMPSVGAMSRIQFVDAWQNAKEERMRKEMEEA